MEHDTKEPQYMNNDRESFAWPSARERWPVIITQAIDDVHRAVSEATEEAVQTEGKAIVAAIAKLKYELQHDRKLTPLPEDGNEDIAGYNAELEQRKDVSWLSATWMFSECYMYRRMQSYFSTSKYWKNYDIFARSKTSAFKSSLPAVLELAAQYKDIITQLEESHKLKGVQSDEDQAKAEELLFISMSEICLWGNKTDLSLMTTMTTDQVQALQGSKARKESEKKILVNDLSKAFQVLQKSQKASQTERRVDIVLDNAGFELFVDLLLAGYLLAVGLATNVILHPKSMPWFVSDVTPVDFMNLLNSLRDSKAFFGTASDGQPPIDLSEQELENLNFLFEHWTQLYMDGKMIIRPHRFWTEGGSFWRLPATAPDLYEDLKESELVIFKGDLNYRKLTADSTWDPTTSFETAIGPLGGKSGVRVLALRTSKADVIVGLPKGKDEELRASQGKDANVRAWAWNGEWAVCQLHDGKTA